MIPTIDPWQSNAGNGNTTPQHLGTCHNQFLIDYLQYSPRSAPSNKPWIHTKTMNSYPRAGSPSLYVECTKPTYSGIGYLVNGKIGTYECRRKYNTYSMYDRYVLKTEREREPTLRMTFSKSDKTSSTFFVKILIPSYVVVDVATWPSFPSRYCYWMET